MKPVSGREFAKLLEGRGWELARVQGSHHIYRHTGRPERISLPIHGSRQLKLGLQRHLMKIAGIADSDL